jgi:hypothetical protein
MFRVKQIDQQVGQRGVVSRATHRPLMQPRRWPAYVGVFAAAFDNFAMTPLVRAIAADLRV